MNELKKELEESEVEGINEEVLREVVLEDKKRRAILKLVKVTIEGYDSTTDEQLFRTRKTWKKYQYSVYSKEDGSFLYGSEYVLFRTRKSEEEQFEEKVKEFVSYGFEVRG